MFAIIFHARLNRFRAPRAEVHRNHFHRIRPIRLRAAQVQANLSAGRSLATLDSEDKQPPPPLPHAVAAEANAARLVDHRTGFVRLAGGVENLHDSSPFCWLVCSVSFGCPVALAPEPLVELISGAGA